VEKIALRGEEKKGMLANSIEGKNIGVE